MQSKNSTSNLLLFFLLATLWLGAWGVLQHWLWPPKPKPVAEQTEHSEAARPPSAAEISQAVQFGAGATLNPGAPGASEVARLGSLALASRWAQAGYPGAEPKTPAPVKPPPVAAGPSAKHEEPILGDDDSFLKVKLTTRGAGVLSVICNQFNAADQDGRPLPEKLELVSEAANAADPSAAVFHYARPEDNLPYETLGLTEWRLEKVAHGVGDDKHDVAVFSADVPDHDLRLVKTYTLRPNDYHVGLSITIGRKPGTTGSAKFRYMLAGGKGMPIEGWWYTSTYRNALVGRLDSQGRLWREFEDSRQVAHKAGGDQVLKGENQRIQYAAIAVQYFASAICVTDKIDPDDPEERATKQDFLNWARATVESVPDSTKPYLDDITMRVVTEPIEIKDSPVVHKYLLYYGPVKVRLLSTVHTGGHTASAELVDRYVNRLHLNTLTDYHSPGAMGSFASKIYWSDLLIFFTNLMHNLLGWLYALIPNYGICIILMTVIVRGLMHPVSRKQARTTIKMQALAPELKKLQEKYKNDRQALGMAQMELYRKHGVSPIGSCWIVFLQMPIFLGLYYALQESIQFRLSPFLWIRNLAAPDMLLWWTDRIPWISTPESQGSFLYLGPYLNLLPIIAVGFMVVQQKFMMPPPTDEQQQMQQSIMKYMMIFFGIMFYKVAAGLCLYFIVSSVWGLAERKLLPKAKPAAAPVPAASPGGPPKASPNGPRPRGGKKPAANGSFQKLREMWEELLRQAKKK